jgi:hypothetical protein
MISAILVVLGVGVLSFAFRSVHHQVAFRIGTLGLVFTSFLAGWLLGGSMFLGAVFASTWFLLPWLEILTRVRRLRLPIHRPLEKSAPPPASRFPGFGDLSDELEAIGFEHSDDVDWSHDGMRQFYRLLYNADRRTAAAICLVEQGEFSFFYLTFSSRAADGRVFMTWNYPFSYGMHLLPNMVANRVDEDLAVDELASEHQKFLKKSELAGVDLAERQLHELRPEFEKDLRLQLEHNIARGILTRDGEELIRYSVRGWFFLWGQFLREFVKFS